ncbi:hypothetical protein NQZ68_019991 [Dissostichus eleginoides]|nr:hypothetical protein NQZ68_019991 [Dissostichus eleginoides]
MPSISGGVCFDGIHVNKRQPAPGIVFFLWGETSQQLDETSAPPETSQHQTPVSCCPVKLYVNLPLSGSLRCVKESVFSYLKTRAPFRRSTCSPSDPPGFTCLAPPTLPPPHSRTSQNVSCLLAGWDPSSLGYLELAAC